MTEVLRDDLFVDPTPLDATHLGDTERRFEKGGMRHRVSTPSGFP